MQETTYRSEEFNVIMTVEEKNCSSSGYSENILCLTPESMSNYDSENQLIDSSECISKIENSGFTGPLIGDSSYAITNIPKEVIIQGVTGVVEYLSEMPNFKKVSSNQVSLTIFLRTRK